MRAFTVLAFAAVIALVAGDCYLQYPPGSNGRLNEANTDRNNGNRLMDTQNNAKGGYCWGPSMKFYEESQLTIEWTNQHGCNNPNMRCNMVIQYMCSNTDADPMVRVRDGTTTNTIPDDANAPKEQADDPTTEIAKASGGLKYGMHESYASYQDCKKRERNMGLFIADREEEGNLNEGRRAAIYTRQNNNGNRHAYECPEERDYYPYWHPSQWKDIAVLVDNDKLCDFFQTESQNVAAKSYCKPNDANTNEIPNNEIACKAVGKWISQDAWGIDAPKCVVHPWTRDNHLGNVGNGFAANFNWTLPNADQEPCIAEDNCNCVLRVRYNISSADINGYGDRNKGDGAPIDTEVTDYRFNADLSPVKQDPIIKVGGRELKLALDTTQFGRTFEDRSHVFHISKRPDGVSGAARVYNLGVRGKRGNIVQTYPATEYDFTPNLMNVRAGDFIHFQWTGCDTNPAGNAGEGTAQTDRSNIVQVANLDDNYPASDDWINANTPLFETAELRETFALINQKNCKTYEQLKAAGQDNDQNTENCLKLNKAGPYFDGGAVKMKKTGTFYYMSTRNNNYTNRSQKGVITVQPLLPVYGIALIAVGGALFVAAAGVGGAFLYSRSHPHSAIAGVFSKF